MGKGLISGNRPQTGLRTQNTAPVPGPLPRQERLNNVHDAAKAATNASPPPPREGKVG